MEPIDRLGRDRHGSVEAERVVGTREVVVDRLRHPDDWEAVLAVEAGRDAKCVLASDRDERVEALGREMRADRLNATLNLVRVRPARAENRAAAGEEPRDLLAPERGEDAVDETAPALSHCDHLVAVIERPLADRPDHRIEPRAVPSARQDSDSHRLPPLFVRCRY